MFEPVYGSALLRATNNWHHDSNWTQFSERDAVHVFDYTAVGVLIASMIVAGALVLQRRKS